MAHITWYKDKKGNDRAKVVYECKTSNGERKRRSKTFPVGTSKRELNKFVREKETEYERSEGICYDKLEFGMFLDDYINLYTSSLSKTTLANYKNMIENRIHGLRKHFGYMKMDKISTLSIQKYVKSMEDDNLKPKTIKNYVMLLSVILGCAQIHGYLDKGFNPCKYVKLPSKEKTSRDIYNTEELKLFVKLVKEDENEMLRIQVFLSLFAGLRRSEIAALKVDAIDLKNKEIHINSARVYAGSEYGNVLKSTKTGSSVRTISICDMLYPVLEKAVRDYKKKRFKCKNFKDTGYLLSKEDGTPYTVESISGRYRRFCERISPHIRTINFHCLRHSFASMLIMSGADVKSVQEMMGHSTLNMTLEVYTHSTTERRRECIEHMDKMFNVKEA